MIFLLKSQIRYLIYQILHFKILSLLKKLIFITTKSVSQMDLYLLRKIIILGYFSINRFLYQKLPITFKRIRCIQFNQSVCIFDVTCEISRKNCNVSHQREISNKFIFDVFHITWDYMNNVPFLLLSPACVRSCIFICGKKFF